MKLAISTIVLGLLALFQLHLVEATCPGQFPQYAACAGKASNYCNKDLLGPAYDYYCTSYCCLSTGLCGIPSGTQKCAGSGGSSGDPVFSGFDGSTFDFQGNRFTYWNILSEKNHQLNAFFTPAIMFDHNGTYISAFGFQYDIHKLSVRVEEDGSLEVNLNGVRLSMAQFETSITLSLTNKKNPAAGSMTVTWELYRPVTGHTVEITTPLLTYTINSVMPGTADEGGVEQPAYLDSSVTLNSMPANNEMNGILGESYNRLVQHLLSNAPINTQHYSVAPDTRPELRVTSLFDNNFPANLFGGSQATHRRALMETSSGQAYVSLQQPLTASTIGLVFQASQASVI